MKLIKIAIAFFICGIFFACQNQGQKQIETAVVNSGVQQTESGSDLRPKEEVLFLNKVKSESDNYDLKSDAIKKDTHIEAFNKYALDSLKKITNWELIVTEINDDPASSNTIISKLGNGGPVYNLLLTAPIQIDRSVDSLAISNRVDFTYTIPKSPKGDALKKQLAIIKTLSKGDVIIVSGSLTHLDANGKVSFASFYDSYGPWNIDLLITDVNKSKVNDYQYLKKY